MRGPSRRSEQPGHRRFEQIALDRHDVTVRRGCRRRSATRCRNPPRNRVRKAGESYLPARVADRDRAFGSGMDDTTGGHGRRAAKGAAHRRGGVARGFAGMAGGAGRFAPRQQRPQQQRRHGQRDRISQEALTTPSWRRGTRRKCPGESGIVCAHSPLPDLQHRATNPVK